MADYTNMIIYGIAGERDGYRAVTYWEFSDGTPSIMWIKEQADVMREDNPDVTDVWLVSNRPRLRREYNEAHKYGAAMVDCIGFRNILRREGILIPESNT